MVNRQRLAVLIVLTAFCLPAYADRGQDAYKHGVQAERQDELRCRHRVLQTGLYVCARQRQVFCRLYARSLHGRHAARPRRPAPAQHRFPCGSHGGISARGGDRRHQLHRAAGAAANGRPDPPAGAAAVGAETRIAAIQVGRRDGRIGGAAAALERRHQHAHDRERGHGLQDHLQNGGNQRDYRSGLQAAENHGGSHRRDHARGVGHGSPRVQDFLAPRVAEHDFCGRGLSRKAQRDRTERHEDVLPSKYLDPG